MQPVMQRQLHDPKNGVNGDCYRAAVASLLEIELEDAPDLTEAADQNGTLCEWLGKNDLQMARMAITEEEWLTTYGPIGYYLASGPSPRFPDCLHVVVYKAGKLAHDPHPEGTGILVVEEITLIGSMVPSLRT